MRTTKLILLILALAVIKATAGNTAEYQASSFISYDSKASVVQSDLNRFDFDLNSNQAEQIFNSGKNHIVVKNFPIRPDYKVDLVLSKQNSALTDDVEIKYFKDGEIATYERKNRDKYFGHIDGVERSDVFLSYSSVGLVGYIQNELGIMYDVSANLSKLGSDIVEHNIAETTIGTMLNKTPTDQCGIDPYENFDPSEISFEKDKFSEIQKDDLLEIKFAADGNFEYYLMFCWFVTQGSYNNWEEWFIAMTEEEHEQAMELAVDYIENVMSATSRIYNREVAMMIKVPYITIFNNPSLDPYYQYFGESLGVKLGAMRNAWAPRSNEAQDRVLATLFADVRRQPANSTTLGIAFSGQSYSGTLCSKNSGYSAVGVRGNVNFPRVSFSQDVQVAAHEFGHNFGCPHTHFCGWPQFGETIIDSCVTGSFADDADCISSQDRRTKQDGTIMSYCHIGGSIVFQFHPRMRERIRDAAIKRLSSCVNLPSEPVVRLIRPLGEEVYFANGKTKIAFNAANVDEARLLYSRNMGKDWTEIGVVNTATDTTYDWDIPAEVGTEYMVRIESTSDESVFDQSVLPFEVTDFSVNPEYPMPGDKIGYLSEQRLSWVKQNVEEVNVKYSLDNGETYKTIESNENITSVRFDFPDQESDEAIFLVESVENPTVNMEIPFILGKENVVFTRPLANDTVNLNFKDYEVEFTRDFIVDEFDIYIKVEDGEWKMLSNFANKVDLEENNFNWIFSNDLQAGQTAQLRATVKGDDTPIGETGVFYLDELTSVKVFSENFNINSISPNPAENTVALSFNNSFGEFVKSTIKIVDLKGVVYKTIENQNIGSGIGSTVLDIDVSDLAVGTYFVIIESDKYKDVKQLKVVR
jgi:hypothetical protein